MKKRLLILIIIAGMTPVSTYPSIIEIRFDAPIHPVTSEYIRKSIEKAEQEDAKLLIMHINTPGGLDTSMRKIIESILDSRVPVVSYVSPSGARAASAGFFISVACDVFVMAPGTSTGAAHPVGISLTGQAMDETMAEKVTHDAAAYIKSLAKKRQRNIDMAEKAVRESLSYTEEEALNGGLIDFIAADSGILIDKLHGERILRFNDTETVLELKDEPVIEIAMTRRQKFLLTISNPNLAYILFMVGLLGLYFEFSNPGAIFPGVIGGICILLAVFSFQILPINYVGLILIFMAVGLFILEIKIQSYGILSLGGIAALLLGSIMLIDAPIPELKPDLSFIIPVALGLSLIFIFLIIIAIRSQAGRVRTGGEGLVGETGTARTHLNPEGKVFVFGEIWDAVADEDIPAGSKIKVVEMLDNLKIKVINLD
ncbi:MAG: nodulation protein NfeD [Candidatus Aminicenantes bacterium]